MPRLRNGRYMGEGENIDLKKLSLDALTGVIALYPWFGSARKELCRRLSGMSGDVERAAEAALYVGDRRMIADLLRKKDADYSDRDAEKLLKACLEPAGEENAAPAPVVRVVGGDYFTQAEYDSVGRGGEDVFASFAARSGSSVTSSRPPEKIGEDWFCTETMAQIYVEQGYFEDAKRIYSKLILAYPEKSAYFAELIEKLDQATSH